MSSSKRPSAVFSAIRDVRAGRRRNPKISAALVEVLEPRQLLSVTSAELHTLDNTDQIMAGGSTFAVKLEAQTTNNSATNWIIDWGDGTTATLDNVGYDDQTTHSYGANDAAGTSHNVSFEVSDISGSPSYYDGSNYLESISSLNGVGTSLTEAQNASFTENLADFRSLNQNLNSYDFTATIQWYDGTPADSGTIVSDDFGGFYVRGSHTYDARGSYPVSIDVMAGDGTSTEIGSEINVIPPDLHIMTVGHVGGEAVANATDGNPVQMVIGADESGQAQIQISSPTYGITGSRSAVHWTVSGDAASVTSGDFNDDTTVTLTPNGSHQYAIQSGSDENNDGVIEDNEKREIDVKVISVSSIKASIGDQNKTSSDTGMTITDDNIITVLQGSSLRVQAQGVQPNDAASKNQLKWIVQRNAADVLTGSPSQVATDLNDKSAGTLSANSAGSFNVTVYIDENNDGQMQDSEKLRVLHLAVINVTLQNNTDDVHPNSNNFTADSGTSTAIVYSGSVENPVIKADAHVLLEGGGPLKQIGVDKIHLGWIQNLTLANFTVNYGPQHKETLTKAAQLSYPLLDNGETENEGTGGDTAFIGGLPAGSNPGYPITGGKTETMSEMHDRPYWDFNQSADFNGQTIHATSTSGGLTFTTYVAGYSTDFDKTYCEYGKFEWTVNFVFTYNPTIFAPSSKWWTDSGSSVQGPNSITPVQGGVYAVTDGPDCNALGVLIYQYT
ncbi:MAG TPA: hypothetical protein VIM11_19090 [Tepidisphaeraceae bacterium]|jgi:hypothetical protein